MTDNKKIELLKKIMVTDTFRYDSKLSHAIGKLLYILESSIIEALLNNESIDVKYGIALMDAGDGLYEFKPFFMSNEGLDKALIVMKTSAYGLEVGNKLAVHQHYKQQMNDFKMEEFIKSILMS